jgi:Ca-activated chloride channel family protein
VLTPAPDVAVNPFTSTAQDPLSTFALDVDTGSYTAARSVIMAGQLPPADTVRVEEFVNYFRYDYPIPEDSAFGITVDGAPSPFTRDTALLRVGIQGYTVAADQRQNAVLTFVVDVSGSMAESNRLPLVKESLKLLVNELKQGDQVGIVVYGSTAHVVLEHTGIDQRERILSAIDSLTNEGSTNAEAGLQLGYQLAAGSFKEGASNRVILCSDGLANVGATGPDAIRASIREQSKKGIYLTTIGVGMGLYNDYLMEQLADDGDGNYAYVNDLAEAQRVFVQNLTGTLQVIARDAKVQVEFDPAVVRQYRLVGYENRAVADADFRNDTVDAGEVGAGHSVTALYEVLLTGQAGNALTVHMRWADPKTSEVREIAQPFASELVAPSFERGSLGFQQAAAVAAFAEVLKGSPYARDLSFGQVRDIADRIAPQMAGNADFQEFAALVARASAFQR